MLIRRMSAAISVAEGGGGNWRRKCDGVAIVIVRVVRFGHTVWLTQPNVRFMSWMGEIRAFRVERWDVRDSSTVVQVVS